MTDRNTTKCVLITGACGQIGTELGELLRGHYERVVVSDIAAPKGQEEPPHFERLDVMDKARMKQLIGDYGVQEVYHLAALLSATGERNPMLAWRVNMDGGLNVLELAEELKLRKVFWPSSIAVFGAHSPKEHTPQYTVTDPDTIYGITKLAGERWSSYYAKKRGVDVRSLRYPGLISYKALPGGGTTDYAVEIFHEALKQGRYECFLKHDTRLPMMYMPDALQATWMLMQAPAERIRVRSAYNVAAMSFTPAEIANEIRRHIPTFEMVYQPDFREQIARSWPGSIDDSYARNDWHWRERFDLRAMVEDMLENLRQTIVG